MDTLRQLWSDGKTALGGWVMSPSTTTSEAMARAGFDYVCVDLQHGVNDYLTTVTHIQAIVAGGGSPIVRVPWNEPGIIGKVLDAGATGVIIPMVNSVEDARAAVAACRYAPDGSRSSGPILAAPRVAGDYLDWAAENVAVIPMIETVRAVDAIDDILDVPGIDAIYMGPSDLSISIGIKPGNNDQDERFAAALAKVVGSCNDHGIIAGIHSTGDLTALRVSQGFRMVTVTADLVALQVGMRIELGKARGSAAGAGPAGY